MQQQIYDMGQNNDMLIIDFCLQEIPTLKH